MDRNGKSFYKEQVRDISNSIEQLFIDNNIIAEFVDSHVKGTTGRHPYAEISFMIEGDWKHTHGLADELVQQNFNVFGIRETDEYSEYDDDYYSSTHQYLIFL